MNDRYSTYLSEDGWLVIDNETQDTIFGDQFPRDEHEAEQCARAANIAYRAAVEATKQAIRDAIR